MSSSPNKGLITFPPGGHGCRKNVSMRRDWYRDTLCERILAVVRAAWAAPEEIVIQLGHDSTIAVSNRVEDVMGAEAAELSTPNGL
jgi:hypothetical protein